MRSSDCDGCIYLSRQVLRCMPGRQRCRYPRGFHRDCIFQVVKQVDGAWHYCTPREKSSEKLFHISPNLSDNGKLLVLSSPHARKAFTLDLEGAPTTPIAATTKGDSEATLGNYGTNVADWLRKATGI